MKAYGFLSQEKFRKIKFWPSWGPLGASECDLAQNRPKTPPKAIFGQTRKSVLHSPWARKLTSGAMDPNFFLNESRHFAFSENAVFFGLWSILTPKQSKAHSQLFLLFGLSDPFSQGTVYSEAPRGPQGGQNLIFRNFPWESNL